MGHTVKMQNADLYKLQITTFAENGKIQLTPKITNHFCTCYSNCMCKSNPVCLIQQSSIIILLASYYPLHRIEFGPPKFCSKTFKFSIIFYSTLQIFEIHSVTLTCVDRDSCQSRLGLTTL